ncbi:MAG: septum formation protein, partial [Glaciecola sp.]
ALVIGADTVVVLDGEVLGKPVDEYDAVAMLRRLSGRTHAVMTGVAVRLGDATEWSVVRTEVMFRALGDGEIKRYVATGEPMDKAGSYAIQGGAGAFIPKITGSDTNVVGLPLHETVDLARKLGVDLLA